MAEPQGPVATVETPLTALAQDNSVQPEAPTNPKLKSRQRLLRGIQRISSSPSLTGLRRARSVSNPYTSSTRSTLSCVSLATTGPLSTPHSLGSTTPQTSSHLGQPTSYSSGSDTPVTEFPFFESLEEDNVPARKIDYDLAKSAHGTAAVPSDAKLIRSDTSSKTRSRAASAAALKKREFRFWDHVPHEVQIYIFSFLEPKELVRTSRVSRSFYRFCFDGQLWTSLDASEFYKDIPAESLARIITSAGPFIKDLNLRGCVQVEHYKRAEVVVKACKNLMFATLEGCRNFQKSTLHGLLESNHRLVYLNLSGLTAVSNKSCKIVAESCPQLETLTISWCDKVDYRGMRAVIDSCTRLKDLRAGEVRGFDNVDLARRIFETNNLERLVLSGCEELSDRALQIMMHGEDPEIDVLTDRPVVPPRKLRHLDLSRCALLSERGIKAVGYVTPELEGLQLSHCKLITDLGLEPILASTPRLTHLELDDIPGLTNTVLSEYLIKAPCAGTIEHLSISDCERLGDVGLLPVLQKCTNLKNIQLDNTRISDLVLVEAAAMVNKRSKRVMEAGVRPEVTLSMAVYDCQNVTWTGIREILFRNAQIKPAAGHPGRVSYPTESISLKCYYGFQMTVDEHQKRVLRGAFEAAGRLERKWADYMQASEEAEMGGSGHRRRRRRAREAMNLHMNEEGGRANQGGRRRARTMGSCFVM